MTYTVHFRSMEIDQEEKDRLLKIGFHDWIFEQAELRNVEYDYMDKGTERR